MKPQTHYLEHSFVEAPERLLFYRGKITLDCHGNATILLPGYWSALCKAGQVWLEVEGAPRGDLFHKGIQIDPSGAATIGLFAGPPGARVAWLVAADRADPWAIAHHLVVERHKTGDERGHYLHPEVYGGDRDLGIGRMRGGWKARGH